MSVCVLYIYIQQCIYIYTYIIVSTTRRSKGIKIPLCLSVPFSEKFNIVSNDHGRKQKCDFCVSDWKTNLTDHHTPDTIDGFRDSVLVCKIYDCYYLQKESISIPSLKAIEAIAVHEIKQLQNVFSTTYTYSNCTVYRLSYY